ncbi:MAG: hypothetical protein UY79_C0003G0107 [Parcubacteria group bacterium GW2011_GWA2_53_21]|nr:MAG: hypothetical protein UY79_C0003G0107 [Parcubacteria group bacterium GW2011_GWA2_53_21]
MWEHIHEVAVRALEQVGSHLQALEDLAGWFGELDVLGRTLALAAVAPGEVPVVDAHLEAVGPEHVGHDLLGAVARVLADRTAHDHAPLRPASPRRDRGPVAAGGGVGEALARLTVKDNDGLGGGTAVFEHGRDLGLALEDAELDVASRGLPGDLIMPVLERVHDGGGMGLVLQSEEQLGGLEGGAFDVGYKHGSLSSFLEGYELSTKRFP